TNGSRWIEVGWAPDAEGAEHLYHKLLLLKPKLAIIVGVCTPELDAVKSRFADCGVEFDDDLSSFFERLKLGALAHRYLVVDERLYERFKSRAGRNRSSLPTRIVSVSGDRLSKSLIEALTAPHAVSRAV